MNILKLCKLNDWRENKYYLSIKNAGKKFPEFVKFVAEFIKEYIKNANRLQLEGFKINWKKIYLIWKLIFLSFFFQKVLKKLYLVLKKCNKVI